VFSETIITYFVRQQTQFCGSQRIINIYVTKIGDDLQQIFLQLLRSIFAHLLHEIRNIGLLYKRAVYVWSPLLTQLIITNFVTNFMPLEDIPQS